MKHTVVLHSGDTVKLVWRDRTGENIVEVLERPECRPDLMLVSALEAVGRVATNALRERERQARLREDRKKI